MYIPFCKISACEQIHKFVNFITIINFAEGMKVIFAKQYLQELYSGKTVQNKKYRFQPHIVKRYCKTIETMIDAKDVPSLARINSLRYEKLQGNKKGLSSVRISDKYRIEFEEHSATNEDIATICNIVELSNHYK